MKFKYKRKFILSDRKYRPDPSDYFTIKHGPKSIEFVSFTGAVVFRQYKNTNGWVRCYTRTEGDCHIQGVIWNTGHWEERRWDYSLVGNEEKGVSPSILKRCHQTLKIPSGGKIDALNVSVATGVILSEINRQRNYEE